MILSTTISIWNYVVILKNLIKMLLSIHFWQVLISASINDKHIQVDIKKKETSDLKTQLLKIQQIDNLDLLIIESIIVSINFNSSKILDLIRNYSTIASYFSLSRFFSVNIIMLTSIHSSNTINSKTINNFLDKNFYSLDSLCKLRYY